MTYRGRVVDGVVLFTAPLDLPNGTEVDVRPVEALPQPNGEGARSTIAERLAGIIGKADRLPADYATNIDHYLYGAPKRK
jgi:hypothetical protein